MGYINLFSNFVKEYFHLLFMNKMIILYILVYVVALISIIWFIVKKFKRIKKVLNRHVSSTTGRQTPTEEISFYQDIIHQPNRMPTYIYGTGKKQHKAIKIYVLFALCFICIILFFMDAKPASMIPFVMIIVFSILIMKSQANKVKKMVFVLDDQCLTFGDTAIPYGQIISIVHSLRPNKNRNLENYVKIAHSGGVENIPVDYLGLDGWHLGELINCCVYHNRNIRLNDSAIKILMERKL